MLVTGCGLIIDTDRQQCKSGDDCAKELGGVATSYVCEEGLCRTKGGCTLETAAQTCGDSPTVQCVDGQCVDPLWGCWNDMDNRLAPTTPTIDLHLQFVSVFTQLPPTSLTAVACRSPSLDPACSSSLPGTSTTYDPSTGRMTVSDIQVSPIYLSYRLKVDTPKSDMLRPLDHYANRPPRDGDPEVLLVMLPSDIGALLPELAADPARGNVMLRIYDCNGLPAPDVEVSMIDPPADLGRVYVDNIGQLSTEQTKTSTKGFAVVYNVPVDRAVTLLAIISPTKQIRFTLRVFADRHAFVDLFPRKFE